MSGKISLRGLAIALGFFGVFKAPDEIIDEVLDRLTSIVT